MEEERIITIVGSVLAKEGAEFTYAGPDAACEGCKVALQRKEPSLPMQVLMRPVKAVRLPACATIRSFVSADATGLPQPERRTTSAPCMKEGRKQSRWSIQR